YNDFNIQPLKQTLEELEIEYKTWLFLKIEIGKEIIGSIRGKEENKTCYIQKLIVHPNYQNKGYGTRLLKGIEEKFNLVTRYELFTSHMDDKNIYLYKKNGYKVFKEQKVNEYLKMVFMDKINQ
ncbi:MAG: GNAT family N-acetyltransferase, partial [Ignavibacteria bacterium]|nr:GNAT family N-acetyltransferase [Ignavibacteria bacterium]